MKSELTECRKTLARYQGAISRWCDMTNHAVSPTKKESKVDLELEAFRKHLDGIRDEQTNWNF